MIKHILGVLVTIASLNAFGAPSELSMTITEGIKVDSQKVIRINAEVRSRLQSQGLNPQDYQLTKVQIIAKSRRGNSQAMLVVGGDSQSKRVENVSSRPAWRSDDRSTFFAYGWNIEKDPGQSDEVWQMHIDGRVKVYGLYATVVLKSENIRIPMNDQVFTGQNTIRIKQKLRDLGYNPQNMNLKSVAILAKSRRGQATMQLNIGSAKSTPFVVAKAKNGYDFGSNNKDSYTRTKWTINGQPSGRWFLDLNGRVKVKALIIKVK